jgi:hypothetical protein
VSVVTGNMIKKFTALLTVLGLSIMLLSTGCKTTNPGTPPAITPQQVERSAVLLKGTVRAALILVIDKNGTNATPYIALARDTISVVIGKEDYSPDALLKSLQDLPEKALKKSEVKLAISVVVSAYEICYGDYVRGQVSGNEIARLLLTAVRDGCADSLLLSP